MGGPLGRYLWLHRRDRGALRVSLQHVRDGIEHHEDPDGFHEPTCGRCAASTTWVECEQCDEGFTHHDCGEDCCACLDPEDNVVCDICLGSCGRYVCNASMEWCEEHPLPDRKEVESTAMSAEAWNDHL